MELLSDKIEALEPDFFRKPGVAGLATTGMGYCSWALSFVFLQ
jgi:hypothetical protein